MPKTLAEQIRKANREMEDITIKQQAKFLANFLNKTLVGI